MFPGMDTEIALCKAVKRYEGGVLKVMDYCQALLMVRDFTTPITLLESITSSTSLSPSYSSVSS